MNDEEGKMESDTYVHIRTGEMRIERDEREKRNSALNTSEKVRNRDKTGEKSLSLIRRGGPSAFSDRHCES